MTIADEPRPEVAAPRPSAAPGVRGRLYRVIWHWHFYAGLLVAPVLLVMAFTGGMYVFKAELEAVFYRDLMFVEGHGARCPLEAQLAAAKAGYPADRPLTVVVPADPARATAVLLGPARRTLHVIGPQASRAAEPSGRPRSR